MHEANDTDADSFVMQLTECLPNRITFSRECVNGKFVKNGCFISDNVAKASKFLYNSLLDLWLTPQDYYVGKQEITNYRRSFYDRYFAKIESVTPTEAADKCVPHYEKVHVNVLEQYQVLRGIIAGYLNKDDNVLYYVCPLAPKVKYEITTDYCLPFFKKLIERRGDNIILKQDDVWSVDFIMAFVESLEFTSCEHKREVLKRMATILIAEGANI